MKCSHRKCPSPATVLATWGPLREPEANYRVPLCQVHLDALWDQVHRLVAEGQLHYQLSSVPEGEK